MVFLKVTEGIDHEELKRIAINNINEWKASSFCDTEEAFAIDDMSESEKLFSFTTLIKFGTAGLRGKMLPGTSNMNKTTIARCAEVVKPDGQNRGLFRKKAACESHRPPLFVRSFFSRLCDRRASAAPRQNAGSGRSPSPAKIAAGR